MLKRAPGFTIVEVLVVVTVIVILATITTLSYNGYQAQSRDNTRSTNANIIAESLETYYRANGEYPSVPALTNTNGSQVTTLLSLKDGSVLVMPGAPSTATNSIIPYTSDGALTTATLAYEATATNTSSCQSLAAGGCDSFILHWKTERSGNSTLKSRS